MTFMVSIGSKITDEAVLLHTGETKKLSQLVESKNLVVYLYPKDDTPGCTAEACSIRDDYSTIQSKANIIGVSADSIKSHNGFISKYKLPFPLVSDPDLKLTKLLGAYGKKRTGGMGLLRSTFILDKNLTVLHIFGLAGYPKVTTASHAKEILEALG